MADLAELIPVSSIPPFNAGLTSAPLSTMIELLGRPSEPLVNNDCRNDQASPAVKRLVKTVRMTPRFQLTGIKPAVEGMQAVLAKVKEAHPDLIDQLSTEGMICVRHKNPPHGPPSTEPSNHSYGTAADFKLVGHDAPKNTLPNVPRYIAMMIPLFNDAGFFAGISFDDAMHFEAAEETMRKWAHDGLLGTPPASNETVVASGDGDGGSGSSDLGAIGGFFGRIFGRG